MDRDSKGRKKIASYIATFQSGVGGETPLLAAYGLLSPQSGES